MRFVSIEFKNIFAYGEQIRKIEYSDTGKMTLLRGVSGSGKSAILSLPMLVLYGKPLRATKAGVANRINKHGWVRGTIIKGQHTYVIEREFSPNNLRVWKDDEEIDTYGSSSAENYIKTEIIEIPADTFANMVTISMRNFKSFLTMSPTERKQVLDEVFDVSIVNRVFDNIKKDAKELGNSINSDNSILFSLNRTLQNANVELAQIQQKNATPENESKIAENNAQIIQLNKNIEQYNEAMQKVNEKSVENQNEYAAKNQEIVAKSGEVTKRQSEIALVDEKINLYNQSKCPTCGISFSDSRFSGLKEQLVEFRQKKYAEWETVSGELTTLKNQLTEIQQKSGKIQLARQQVNDGLTKIRLAINNLQNENNLIVEKAKASSEYQAVENIIKQTQQQVTETQQTINEKTKKLTQLQLLQQVYSLDGVLKLVIEQWIPVLNDEIAENLIMLNFPYTLKFDNKLNAVVSDLGTNVPIDTLSDGETTRLNICILISFLKVLMRKYPSLNILTLDETVSTLDPMTSELLLNIFYEYAQEQGLNIIVVSHTDLNLELFDEVIKVEKVNGFSQFEVVDTSKF